ncbi:MAG: hypothetical protein IJT90_07920 [Bacteroidaceae bacterium]|nr:hypothetical protein [Bacteroidaceae bacterium]
MYLGKKKCRTLRTIRKQIAEANGISYNPHRCNHKGDCQGTCPACEQEMRQLESEIRKRRFSGRAAVVVGTAMGISMLAGGGMTSCRNAGQVVGKVPAPADLRGDVPNIVAPSDTDSTATDKSKGRPVEVKKISPEEAREILEQMPEQPVQQHKRN